MRAAIRAIAMRAGTNCAGIIRSCGGCFRIRRRRMGGAGLAAVPPRVQSTAGLARPGARGGAADNGGGRVMRGVMENLARGRRWRWRSGRAGRGRRPTRRWSDGPDQRVGGGHGSGADVALHGRMRRPGPKVIDVFGGSGRRRGSRPRARRASCTVVKSAGGYGSATPRQNYTGYSMYAPMSGVSTGLLPQRGAAGRRVYLGRVPVQFPALGRLWREQRRCRAAGICEHQRRLTAGRWSAGAGAAPAEAEAG